METPAAPEKEIPRHSLSVRITHWVIALCFIAAMATGLTLYWSSILKWAVPYFGGEQSTIAIHFVGGLALAAGKGREALTGHPAATVLIGRAAGALLVATAAFALWEALSRT